MIEINRIDHNGDINLWAKAVVEWLGHYGYKMHEDYCFDILSTTFRIEARGHCPELETILSLRWS